MADQKISQLTLGTPTGSDVIPYVDGASGITKKALKSSLLGPQGTQGSQGSQGATGAQGATGNQGTQGSVGATGNQGTQGSQGATGAQGATGNQGTQGSQGATGNQGTQGSASTVAGPQGTQGSIGNQGTQGSQGSASTAPGVQGTQGSIGLQGTQGSQGSLGATGNQGTQGSVGATGNQGTQGSVGNQGTQGSQGTGNTPRVTQLATAGSAAPNADSTDTFRLTAQTLTADFVNPSGTPTNGQKMVITILPSNGNRNLSWGSAYTAGGVALPTSVTQAKRTTIGFEYDTSNSLNAWMCLGLSTQI